MIKLVEKEHCSGCTACMACCPKEAISMCADEEGFKYPVIDRNQCVECEKCVRTCPVTNKQKKNPVVGSNVIGGQNIRFHAENHLYDNPDQPIYQQGVTHKGIEIGDNCWIGAGVVFLDGAKIGNGCVVAANAVVTKSFGDNLVIGGIPAKKLRDRVTDNVEG